VQREHGGVGVHVVPVTLFEGARGDRVKLPPQGERKSFVGDLTQRRATEPDVAVELAVEDAGQTAPDLLIEVMRGRIEDLVQAIDVKREAEDGRSAHERAVAGIERVDPRAGGSLDAVGKRPRATGRGGQEIE
jgi:hypothetical protein